VGKKLGTIFHIFFVMISVSFFIYFFSSGIKCGNSAPICKYDLLKPLCCVDVFKFEIWLATILGTLFYGFILIINQVFKKINFEHRNGILNIQFALQIKIVNEIRSEVTREQIFYVDKAGVNAYRTYMACDAPQGSIDFDSLNAEPSPFGDLKSVRIFLTRLDTPLKYIEFIDKIENEFQHSQIARIIPTNIIILFNHLFNAVPLVRLYRRHFTIFYNNEHFNSVNFQTLQSTIFHGTNVKMKLLVPNTLSTRIAKVEVIKFSNNAASIFNVNRRLSEQTGFVEYFVHEKNLIGESLQLRWYVNDGPASSTTS